MASVLSCPTVRKRARKPKVKTGCKTCRRRHLKCDERRPACLRCTKTGRICDGYEVKGNAALLAALYNEFTDPSIRSLLTFPRIDDQERRALQFFFSRTAPEIAGFLPSDFWDKLIPQACYGHAAILHAVIALGAAHETYEVENQGHMRSGMSTRQHFALQQSNKAINHLLTQFSGEFVLLFCILFICLETFQGNHQAALAHLESGLKILGVWLHDDSQLNSDLVSRPTRQFLEEELVPLFTRLDVQATTYLTSRSLREVKPHSSTKAPLISPRFTSLRDANNQLADLVHWMLYSYNASHNMTYWMVDNPMAKSNFRPPSTTSTNSIPRIPDRVQNKITKIEKEHSKILEQWLDTLNIFRKDNTILDVRDVRGVLMLKILHTSTKIIKTASLYNHDMEYDKYIPDFEKVIKLAESLINFKKSATKNNTLVYSFEMNILPPLHYCSTRCRDPKLRRKALALLEDSPRREGMWDSTMLAAIARYVIQEEEAGLGDVSYAEEILAEKRICILDKIPMLEQKMCVIKYCKGVRDPYAPLDIRNALINWQGGLSGVGIEINLIGDT